MTARVCFRVPTPRRKVLGRDLFTTGQTAGVCSVAPRTVAKWCDSGRLKCHRIPGSDDRRITRADLVAFARQEGVELNLGPPATVACLTPGTADRPAVSPTGLGAMLAHAAATDVLIGCGEGLAAAVTLARDARKIDPAVRLTLLLPEDRPASDVPAGLFDEVRS